MLILLEVVLSILGFFDYWISNFFNKGKKFIAQLLQVVFIISISLLLSAFVLIVITILSTYVIGEINILSTNLAILFTNLLIIFWLLSIVFLNRKTDINLPQHIIELVVILTELKSARKGFGFWGMLIYLIVSTAIASIFTVLILTNLLGYQMTGYGITIIICMNLLLVISLYSELTFDEVERSIRQMNLWTLLFVILLSLTFIELKNSNEGDINYISSSLLIFGLVYNIATIADKIRKFIELKRKELKVELDEARVKLQELNANKNFFEESRQAYYFTRLMWLAGDWKNKMKIIGVILFAIISYILVFWFSFR